MPRARARLLLATVLLLPGCRTAEPPARSRADTPGGARTDTAAAAAATCGVTSRYALGDSGVGALRVGAPLAAVRAACRVVRDTTGPGAEGMPERVALVDVGAAAVAATIVHDSVWRLSVTDSLLRTADSLGVGTPLG
ncbi:MAG TPA: hypothetical protein VFS40_10855, partial [Gemmatimonadales bacterium]|nr:hypothetical protein [Gemmatimonadales bacterium]